MRSYDRCYCGDERLRNVVGPSGLRFRVCNGPIDLIHGNLPKREAWEIIFRLSKVIQVIRDRSRLRIERYLDEVLIQFI